VYTRVRGVASVQSGYANGRFEAPSYEQVCTGQTGHVEVVRLEFDPSVVSLAALLDVFFQIHDPTTLNRQGNDVGPQYRSGIYTLDEAQRAQAAQALDRARAAWGAAVVTEVQPLVQYHQAEAEHQRYFELHPHQGYCAYVVAPKVNKFTHQFASMVKTIG
jgi:peptide-methionine (S)-S-oxide reductase